MIDLGVKHGLEYDLARFLWREGLDGQFRIAKCLGFQFCEVSEFAIEAPGQTRNRDVEFVDVFVRRFGIHFDDERVLPFSSACAAHWDSVKGDAFVLD